MKRLLWLWFGMAVTMLAAGGTLWYLWQSAQAHAAQQRVQQVASRAEQQIASAPQTHQPLQGKPVRLVVPRLGIDIAIVDGHYNAVVRDWTVSKAAANWAVNTVPVNNNRGITFIYGHDTKQILAPTERIATGDTAYVYTDNGHVFSYTYQSDSIVKPADTQLFDQLDGAPGIKLMTCDGAWSQNRRIMNFNLVSAA